MIEDFIIELRTGPESTATSAEFINRVNEALGDDLGPFAKNRSGPFENDGTNLIIALMYQNLLLARRIEYLEEAVRRQA